MVMTQTTRSRPTIIGTTATKDYTEKTDGSTTTSLARTEEGGPKG